jgi:hypothetical protein
MKKVCVAAIAALCVASAANALSVNSYRNEKDDEIRKLNRTYLAGVRDGMVVVNHAIEVDGDQPYFCVPSGEELRVEQAENIIFERVQASRTFEHMPIWAVLFEGLKNKFACHTDK